MRYQKKVVHIQEKEQQSMDYIFVMEINENLREPISKGQRLSTSMEECSCRLQPSTTFKIILEIQCIYQNVNVNILIHLYKNY